MSNLDLTRDSTNVADGPKPALSEAEFRQRLTSWNHTAADYPRDKCVHELVEAQTARRPDAVAVVGTDATLTYRELNERANQVAHRLRALGIGPDALVAICLERSPEMLVGLLGILKAGGAYVPLDPAYPRERLAFMVRDSGARVLLTQNRLRAQMDSGDSSCQVLCLDGDAASLAIHPASNPLSGVKADRLAYVIYTSGTTGEPKGVELTHGGLLNLIFWHQRTYRVGPEDKATHVAGVGFDASVWEIWPYLTAGASLHLPTDEIRLTPEKLRDWLVAREITLTFAPTPMAEKLVRLAWPARPALRAMLTGGDRLKGPISPQLPFPLVNHYGPTENTVVTTCGTVEVDRAAGKAPPIGRPIANTQVHLLDEKRRPVALGATGEIYVGGDGLARGYHQRPELTAEKFISNPLTGLTGDRLFRTGDLARYLPSGEIEFLGRTDDQVKIRGYRIELGEIEVVLARHPGIGTALVMAREDGTTEKRLVAYVKTHVPAPTVSELRDHLKRYLPDYMVPGAFVMLHDFPLTPNGKIDRAALPAPECGTGVLDPADADALSEVEAAVAPIVATLLGVDRVAAEANFFDLGGHSLLATRLIARVRDEFGIDLPLLSVFNSPTIADLCAEIEQILVEEIGAMSEEEIQRSLEGSAPA